jgi:hypothetical protein
VDDSKKEEDEYTDKGEEDEEEEDEDEGVEEVEVPLERLRDDLCGLVEAGYNTNEDPFHDILEEDSEGGDKERDRLAQGYLRSKLIPAIERGYIGHNTTFRELFQMDNGRVKAETVDIHKNIPKAPIVIDLTGEKNKGPSTEVTLEEIESSLTKDEREAWGELDKELPAICLHCWSIKNEGKDEDAVLEEL